MKCPFCTNDDTYVTDSRNIEEGTVIRRRRTCHKCKGKLTTYERIQIRNLTVIKKSGISRAFDREKIGKSITAALCKQNISSEKLKKINDIVDKIILYLKSNNITEIHSRKIGELIMEELFKIDSIAYIRFASVYKDFTTIKDFTDFINNTQTQKS